MDEDTERQFQLADAAVDKAVAAFISNIELMSGRWDAVAPAYIVERMLLMLCDQMTKLIDDPDLANSMGPAMGCSYPTRWPISGILAKGGARTIGPRQVSHPRVNFAWPAGQSMRSASCWCVISRRGFRIAGEGGRRAGGLAVAGLAREKVSNPR